MNTWLAEESYVDQATDGETKPNKTEEAQDWLIPCSDEEEGNVTGDAGDIASNTVPTSPSSAASSFHNWGPWNRVTAIW